MDIAETAFDLAQKHLDGQALAQCGSVVRGDFVAIWRTDDGVPYHKTESTKALAGGSVPDDAFEQGSWAIYECQGAEYAVVDLGRGCDPDALMNDYRHDVRSRHPAIAGRR